MMFDTIIRIVGVFAFSLLMVAMAILALSVVVDFVVAVVNAIDDWRQARWERRRAMLCRFCWKKTLAYPGALYCGAACSARAEVASYREKPKRVCKDVEPN